MPILQGDIKLIASQVMNDVPEGGGAPSGVVIADGASNDVFNDISELDRAGGRVNFRKMFVHVRTPNADGYFGANLIVAKPYADPRVSVTLFTADDPFDRRAAAANRVESYLARGAVYQGYLFGDHLAGQGTLSVLQRPELPLPGVGDTMVLRKNEGLPTQYEEYVRLRSVTSRTRVFTDANGDFTRALLTLEITNVLQQDFPGFDAMRVDSAINYQGRTKLCETTVADAARYYGVVKLDVAAALGDFTIKAASIFSQLVPSTRQEVPIADARVNQQSAIGLDTGSAGSQTVFAALSTAQPLFIGNAVVPGSLTLARNGVTLTDKGGVLYNAGTAVGTFDYSNGVARLSTNVFGTGPDNIAVTARPAAIAPIVTDSLGLAVTQAGQRVSWVYTLDPVPARGSLQVSYRALGRWYTLSDDGSGALRGADSAYGAGTINFTTGTVSLTLGALPDVGSRILSQWASTASSRALGDVPAYTPAFNRKLRRVVTVGTTIKPGTVSLAWNDGVARTATDLDGALTGDATGAVSYSQGTIQFTPNSLPAKGTAVALTLGTTVERKAAVPTFTDSGSTWTFSLGGAVKPRGVEIGVVAQYLERTFPGTDVATKRSLLVLDDGAGNLVVGNLSSLLAVGTVNYGTGACALAKSVAGLQSDQPTFASRAPGAAGDPSSFIKQVGYETRTVALTILNGNGGTVLGLPAWAWWGAAQADAAQYRCSGVDAASGQSFPFTVDEIQFPILDLRRDVGGGVALGVSALSAFRVGGSRYVLGANRVLVRDPSPATGEGSAAGTCSDVAATLTAWPVGASPTLAALNGVVSAGVSGPGTLQLIDTVTARTAVAPLLPAALTVAGTWSDGSTFTATGDSNGVISTGTANAGATPGTYGVFGRVDYETGLVDLRFGRRVAAPGTGVIDVSALGVPGLTYLESRGVQADTLRYNAVGYSYLPLDPAILGLNTVRLPADGRVPIFRPGGFVVVGNTATTSPATMANGQTINCARVRLSRVRVVDANGSTVNAGFTANLDAGTVTFTNVAGYAQPVTVEHRVEDMMLLSDVQINGQLTFTRPLTHAYPTADTYVSSALVIGDVKARVSMLFDQQTWSNVWQDAVNGSPASATYNDVQFPLVVTNSGALTERWACVFQNNNTSFILVGEHLGVVATGSVNLNFAPLNPTTGQPYVTIPSDGWGSGWVAGNALRFNTVGAIPAFWALRTILQGPETVTDDSFTLLSRGDVDRP